jgi:hypothetical protein
MRANKVYFGGIMRLLTFRWFVLITIVVGGFVGVVTSNVGCGSDSAKSDAGGGTTGGGGHAGSTGTGGSGGAVTLRVSYTFDTATSSDTMGWKLNDYVDGTPAKNLGAFVHPDAGLTLANPPTIEWANDDSESSPSSGSVKVSVTFDSFGQYVDPVINLSAPVDLANRTLSMKVRLVSGTFSTGGVQFHFSTGAYVYSGPTFTNASDFVAGQWKVLSIDTSIATPADPNASLDPSMTVQLGLQITAGGAFDGGTPPAGRLVFEIDTVKG